MYSIGIQYHVLCCAFLVALLSKSPDKNTLGKQAIALLTVQPINYTNLNSRFSGSTAKGGHFDAPTIIQVWLKASAVAGHDPANVRKDRCGAWIRYSEYGKTTDLGWEIDHDRPVALGGGDDLSNLQPLNWQNNRAKSDKFPTWACAISAKT